MSDAARDLNGLGPGGLCFVCLVCGCSATAAPGPAIGRAAAKTCYRSERSRLAELEPRPFCRGLRWLRHVLSFWESFAGRPGVWSHPLSMGGRPMNTLSDGDRSPCG